MTRISGHTPPYCRIRISGQFAEGGGRCVGVERDVESDTGVVIARQRHEDSRGLCLPRPLLLLFVQLVRLLQKPKKLLVANQVWVSSQLGVRNGPTREYDHQDDGTNDSGTYRLVLPSHVRDRIRHTHRKRVFLLRIHGLYGVPLAKSTDGLANHTPRLTSLELKRANLLTPSGAFLTLAPS